MKKTLTGIEAMRGIAEGRFPHPPMAKTIPMKMTLVKEGEIVFETCPTEVHLNPLGMVHGGFAASVLDSATGCAVHTLLGAGDSYATIDLNVKFLKLISKGKTLVAEGRVLNISRQLGVAEAVLKDEEGTLYAHATASCMIKRSTTP